jgi:predicted ferric reductase
MNALGKVITPAAPPGKSWIAPMLAYALALAIAASAVAAGFASHASLTPWALTAGRVAAMTALAMFMTQFAISARARWLDRAFGLDRLYRIHATIGAAATMVISAHPFLVYWSGARSTDPATVAWSTQWPQLVGAAGLMLAWLVVATAVWRTFLGLSYEAWRWIHRLTFVVVLAGLVHAFSIGADLRSRGPVWWYWVFASIAYAVGFIYVKFVRPAFLRRFTVASVRRVSHDTVNVEMKPRDGRAFSHLPGQFVFVRFASASVPAEEHPFTISSSPAGSGAMSLTIKQSGDFTGTIDRLKPQDPVRVHGPFGRFSHVLLARDGEALVMIAGGIGITPMLSMLRYLAEAAPARRVTLIWANRTEQDIVFRDELDRVQRGMANLTVHHVLSRQRNWQGETGHIDRAMLNRLLGREDRAGRAFVCGPSGMMDAIGKHLRKLGFPRRKIHAERFALS